MVTPIRGTRLAGSKADNWFLRQSPNVLELPFLDHIRRADRDNAIDLYMGVDYMDVLADGKWENMVKAGIIDPTKVTRTALQNAASIAALLLTTEAVVADIPDDKSSKNSAAGAPGQQM